MQTQGLQRVPLQALFGGSHWQDVSWCQFLQVTSDSAKHLQDMAPEVPYLGAAPPGNDDQDLNRPADPTPTPSSMQDDDEHMPDYTDDAMASTVADSYMPPPLPPPSNSPPPSEPMHPAMSQVSTIVAGPPYDQGLWVPSLPTPAASATSRSALRSRSERRVEKKPSTAEKRSAPSTTASQTPLMKKQSRGSSSGHVPVLPLTAEEARSVEQKQVAAQAQPVPSNNSLAPTVQYGNPIDTSSSTIPYDDNDMPAHESPSDVEVIDDSDEEDDFYCQPLFPPPIAKAWTYYRDVETVLEGQAECFPSSHHEQSSQKLGIADRDLEIEIPYADRNWYFGLPKFKEDEVLIYKTKNFKKGAKSSPLIEKSLDALSSQEIKENWPAVQQAISNELQSFIDHTVFARQPKSEAQNLCTSRWVLRWKLIDGKRAVKARLTIRGFQDQQEVNNYAGTATRWSQRLVVSIAVQEQWKLWIADVATAFLQSDTFEQLEHAGDATRDVSFSPPSGYEQEYLKLKGFETMTFQREVFKLLRPAYGLRDAPHAWKRKLDGILKKLGAVVMPTDASLYCFYQN